jgi:hypothetical protein
MPSEKQRPGAEPTARGAVDQLSSRTSDPEIPHPACDLNLKPQPAAQGELVAVAQLQEELHRLRIYNAELRSENKKRRLLIAALKEQLCATELERRRAGRRRAAGSQRGQVPHG